MSEKVYDENGKELKHPDEIKDMVNDSIYGAMAYMNYKAMYEKLQNTRKPSIEDPLPEGREEIRNRLKEKL